MLLICPRLRYYRHLDNFFRLNPRYLERSASAAAASLPSSLSLSLSHCAGATATCSLFTLARSRASLLCFLPLLSLVAIQCYCSIFE